MTSINGIERLREVLGGRITSVDRIGKPTWQWMVAGKGEVRRVLEMVVGELVVKQPEAREVLRLLDLLDGRKPGVAYSAQEACQIEETYWQLREMKKRA